MRTFPRNLIIGLCAAALFSLAGVSSAENRSDWPRSITVGTASQGGTYYIYGSGWANLVGETLDINAGAEVTGGPVQNATLVQTGEHEFGMVTMGPAYLAWTGESELAPGLEHKDIRAVFPMYQTIFQIITRADSDIESVADLQGKTVGIGPAGGTSDLYFPQFFEILGIDVRTQNGGAADQASQLQDGLIDAFAFAAGLPISAFSQLEAQTQAHIFSFSDENRQKILDQFPELSPATVPASTYQTLTEDAQAISIWNFAITHKDMPESLVYETTKTVMENHDRMMQIHGASAETLPENIEYNTFLPFHPGAVRWFEENGHDIPDELEG